MKNKKQTEKQATNDYRRKNIDTHIDTVQQIKKDNQQLKDEIEIEDRQIALNNKFKSQQMGKLNEQGFVYAKKIDKQTRKNIKLTDQIVSIENQIENQKKSKINIEGEEMHQIKKKIRDLENNLEKTRQKQNQAIADIKRLKEDVNIVRRERVIFDNVFKKLEIDLRQREEELKKYLIESTQVDNQKNIILDELNNTQQSTEYEKQQFLKIYETVFIEKKEENNINRLNKKSVLQEDSVALKKSQHNISNNMSNNLRISKKYNQKNAIEQEITIMDNIFERIRLEANVQDVDEFIAKYQNQDVISEKLYQESNEMDDQIEKLQTQIVYYQDIERKKQQELKFDDQNEELADFKETVIKAVEKNKNLNQQNITIQKQISQVDVILPEILQELGLQDIPVIKDIDSYNIMKLLQFMQEKTFEIFEKTPEESKNTKENQNFTQDNSHHIFEIMDQFDKVKDFEKIMTYKEMQAQIQGEITKLSDNYKNRQSLKLKKK